VGPSLSHPFDKLRRERGQKDIKHDLWQRSDARWRGCGAVSAGPIPFVAGMSPMRVAQPGGGAVAAEGLQQPSGLAIEVDDDTGAVTFRDAAAPDPSTSAQDFDDNLAERLPAEALAVIAEELLRGIAADERSRQEMLDHYTRGMDLLGLRLEGDAGGFAAGQGGKNISKVRHPILLWACVRFQAGARNELLPAAGPVKAKVDGTETPDEQQLARDFEQDFNHYLTVT
jgi:hypothetical protein